MRSWDPQCRLQTTRGDERSLFGGDETCMCLVSSDQVGQADEIDIGVWGVKVAPMAFGEGD